MSPAYTVRTQNQAQEGIAVVGEAVRRVAPESVEFLIELTAHGQSAGQALSNHQTVFQHVTQSVATLGLQRADLQTVSMNVAQAFAPGLPPAPFAIPQLGSGFPAFGAPPNLPEIQFGNYQARSLVRVTVRDASRAGQIADAFAKAGANLVGGLSYRAADEAGARKLALEAAGKDARAKAESLAASAGKQLGDPVAISEEMVASNGVYSALRAQMPWAFGPDTPSSAGELEYYARVTASFRFQ